MMTWSDIAELHPGDSIRDSRTDLGWTQAELSRRTGVPQADISRIENGRLDARWSTIQRISAALAEMNEPPRRSLANGRKSPKTATASTPWSPHGIVYEIDSTDPDQ